MNYLKELNENWNRNTKKNVIVKLKSLNSKNKSKNRNNASNFSKKSWKQLRNKKLKKDVKKFHKTKTFSNNHEEAERIRIRYPKLYKVILVGPTAFFGTRHAGWFSCKENAERRCSQFNSHFWTIRIEKKRSSELSDETVCNIDDFKEKELWKRDPVE